MNDTLTPSLYPQPKPPRVNREQREGSVNKLTTQSKLMTEPVINDFLLFWVCFSGDQRSPSSLQNLWPLTAGSQARL